MLLGLLLKFIHCIYLFDNDPMDTYKKDLIIEFRTLKNFFPQKSANDWFFIMESQIPKSGKKKPYDLDALNKFFVVMRS